MGNAPRWSSAASLPVPVDGRPRAELTALAPGGFTVDELFTFMRDAELRFATLRMRIEERRATSLGEELRNIDVAIRHPGEARVTTSNPALGTAGNYELWISNGETIRTYSAPHRLGRQRPARPEVRGLDDSDLPGAARVYRPLTALPKETLPETFIHPAGYCQNVLATGRCRVAGTDTVSGREAILLECDHPRSVELAGDRPDHRIRMAIDRETGVITRLTESIGDRVTRHAEVVSLAPNASLPPATFDFAFPEGTTFIY